MTDRQWIIGSDTDVDVFLGDSVVSRRHCRLSLHQSQYFIEDLASRNGTFLGQERIVTRTAINPGVEVMLAGSVPMPWPDEALAVETLSIGRIAGNDIVIDDESVSSKHAVLFRDPNNRWLVRDLGSTNGTRLGDDRIVSMTCLHPSDVVLFGSVAETLNSLRRQVHSNLASKDSGSGGTTKRNVDDPIPPESNRGGLLASVNSFWSEFPPAARRVSLGCILVSSASILWWWLSGQGMALNTSVNRESPITSQAEVEAPLDSLDQPAVDEDEGEVANTPPVVALKSKSSRSVQSSLESRLRESFYWVTLSSDEHSFRIGAALAVDQYRLLTPTATMSQLLELSESMSGQVCNVMDRSIAPVDALAFHETWLGNQEIDETSLAILPDLLSQYRSNGSDPKSEIGRKLTVVYQRAIAAQNALRSLGVGLLRVKEPLKHHMDRFGNDRERDLWIEGPSATVRKMVKSPLVGPFYDPEEVLVDKQTNFNWTKLNVRFLIGLPLVSTQTTGQRTGPFFRIGKVSMGKNSSLDLSGAAVLDDQGRFAGMLTSPSTLPVENRGKFEALLDPDDVAYDWVPRDTIRLVQQLDVPEWQSLGSSTYPPE